MASDDAAQRRGEDGAGSFEKQNECSLSVCDTVCCVGGGAPIVTLVKYRSLVSIPGVLSHDGLLCKVQSLQTIRLNMSRDCYDSV